MSKTLREIAEQLKNANKKVQLIYAFNGVGKTRLSREFKQQIAPKNDSGEDGEESEQPELVRSKILYYNAFTEDLFYWDNDLEGDAEPKLKIQPSDNEHTGNLKISKGEESNFIWSIFYTLLDQVISVLNVAEPSERETDQFDQLEYVFIDDPVSSLDENHLIELAIDLARLIKSSESGIKFVITTHNPLFYNVLYNEFKKASKYLLKKNDDGLHELVSQSSDSPFSYHLYLRSELKKASETGQISKYHFNFIRNVLEKTSTFLGYEEWGDLLPDEASGGDPKTGNPYARIINFYNHAKHAGDEITEVKEDHKRVFKFLVEEIDKLYQVKR